MMSPLSVRLGAVMVEEQHGLDRNSKSIGDGAGAARQLFHRDAGRDRVEAGAACAFAQANAEQAEIGHALVERAVEAVLAVDRGRAWQDLRLREAPGGLAQGLLVLGIEAVHGVWFPSVAGELGIVSDLALVAIEEVHRDVVTRHAIGTAHAPR